MDHKKQVRKNYMTSSSALKLPPIHVNREDSDVRTVLDVDPHYFSLVDGRRIRPNTSINVYNQNIRNVALKKTLRGFIEDEILRIDREMKTEREIYDNASKHFEECKASFDKFLADDNNQTISVMKKSDALGRELANKTEEHRKTTYDMASLKSKLQYVDDTIMILLTFENFLHRMSPVLWQTSNNINLSMEHKEIFTMDSDIYQQLDTNLIKERIGKIPPPKLYFEKPEQLLEIFSFLERQNLNYLLKTEEINYVKIKFLEALDTFKNKLDQELEYIQKKIKHVENEIEWNIQRESELKNDFFKILEEKIRYLVSSETALKLFNYVEYAYEKLIAPNDTDQSTLDMILALESEYNSLMIDLSGLDPKMVKIVEKQIFEDNEKRLQEAKKAHSLLKNVDKIKKRLKSCYEPIQRNNTT